MNTPRKFFFDRLDSTNKLASKWATEKGREFPFWIRTDDQFQGKGQGKNSWYSAPRQNLTGSLAIQPFKLQASNQFFLSMSVALGILDFLELFSDNISIKWPNDLYCGEKKIGGILIENAISGNEILFSVIGIGININQSKFPEAIPNPVSLCQVCHFSLIIEELEDLLIYCLLERLQRLTEGNLEKIRSEYVKRLFRYKEWAPYRSRDQWINARILDVEPLGALLVEGEDGNKLSFGFQEIEFIL